MLFYRAHANTRLSVREAKAVSIEKTYFLTIKKSKNTQTFFAQNLALVPSLW